MCMSYAAQRAAKKTKLIPAHQKAMHNVTLLIVAAHRLALLGGVLASALRSDLLRASALLFLLLGNDDVRHRQEFFDGRNWALPTFEFTLRIHFAFIEVHAVFLKLVLIARREGESSSSQRSRGRDGRFQN